MVSDTNSYDAIIVGAGTSGSCVASALSAGGLRCLILEAGKHFTRDTYPRTELDANSQLYWGGGLELNTDANIGFLRARVVGGGSIVNQALMDRFDDVAFDSWRERSGVPFFTTEAMAPWYDKAESELCLQYIPTEFRNRNAHIFAEGFAANGYVCAPLRRAQRDCRFQDGNDCIVCLAGCPIDSKQSMPVTVLRRALEAGAQLQPECEVLGVADGDGGVTVTARTAAGEAQTYRARLLVLAGGAIGTSSLLLRSGFGARVPLLGRNFYVHEAIYPAFRDALVRAVQQVKQEVDRDGDADIGAMTTDFQVRIVRDQVDDARRKGARFLTGDGWDGTSRLIPPMVVDNVSSDMLLIREETFGPLLPLVPFANEAEAIRLAEGSEYGLTASVWSKDLERARRVVRALRTGGVSINNVMVTEGNPALPFGGVKQSGFGRYKGEHGLHAFCNVKSVIVDKDSGKIESNWYPYTREKYGLFSDLTEHLFGRSRLALLKFALAGMRLERYSGRAAKQGRQ